MAQAQGFDALGRAEVHHPVTIFLALFCDNAVGQVKPVARHGRQLVAGEVQIQGVVFLVQGVVHQHTQERSARLRLRLVEGKRKVVMLARFHVFNHHGAHAVGRALGIHHVQFPFEGRCRQVTGLGKIAIGIAEHQGFVGLVRHRYLVTREVGAGLGVELGRNHGTGKRSGKGQFAGAVGLDVGHAFPFVTGRIPAHMRIRAGNGFHVVVPYRKGERFVGQGPVIGHLHRFTALYRRNLQGEGGVGLAGLGLHHRRHRQIGGQAHGKEAFLLRLVRLARAGYQRQHREKAKRVSHRTTRHRIRQVFPGSGPCCPSPSG